MDVINIGITADDGTGDPIRNAFAKINSNFAELLAAVTGMSGVDVELNFDAMVALQAALPVLASDHVSLTAAVAAIGAVNKRTLLVSTPTTLTADTNVTSNINLIVTNPGVIDCGAYTLTGLKESQPEWFVSPGAPDMGAAIQKAVDAALRVFFQPTTYAKSININVPANRELYGPGAIITTTAEDTNGFTVTGSNVTFRGLDIRGPQYTVLSTSRGISAVGASSVAYLETLKVLDCKISSWGRYGAYMQFVDGFDFTGTTIENVFYAGIMGLSVQNGVIPASTSVKHVVGQIGGSAYGISMTRDDHDSLVTHPRSKNVRIDALVDDVPYWNGIGTHGGENISLNSPIVTNCKIGIEAVAAGNTAHDSTFAPLNFNVVNPTIDSGVTDGSAGPGIRIAGAGTVVGTPVQLATGSIKGGTITGHGDQSNANDGSVYLVYTQNIPVSVAIREPGRHGIALYHDNYGVAIAGTTVVDAWTNSGAAAYAISATSDYNTGTIGANSFITGSKSATHVMDFAIRTGTGANNRLALGQNYSTATGYAIDGSTGDIALTGTFFGSATYDPPNIANGASTTTTVSVTNATPGNIAQAAFSTALPSGVTISKVEVTGTGSVTVTISNASGSDQNLAEGTLSVVVFK